MSNAFDFSNKTGIANYKRIAEYSIMVPGFSEEFKSDRAAALKKYGLSDVTSEDKEAYDQFMNAKLSWRDNRREVCAPDNNRMRKWRERQKNRCMLSFPDMALGIVHIPVMYELSSGCSVGCKFCGVGAKGLQSVYRYNDENKQFFKDILNVSKNIIGKAAGYGALYFATEPLDNPDYEKFKDAFAEVNGEIPQVTTSVPLRDVKRTKKLIAEINEANDIVYRFSVRSLDEFYGIMENFTAEELIYTELLPQFSEAPGNRFVKSGRSMDDDGIETSISCISGFLVNMCEKSVKLTTPVIASKKFPEGMAILMYEKFETVSEYEDILKRAIAEKMKTVLDPDEKLKVYSNIEYTVSDGKVGLVSKNGAGTLVDQGEYDKIYECLYNALKEGNYTRKEIGQRVSDELNLNSPISIFSIINKFWNFGFIYDQSVFGLEKE